MWQLSIRSKIILILLLTGLACLAAGTIIGYLAGEAALTQSVEVRLTTLREIKRLRVEAYVRNELRFTTAVATSAETVEATKAFIAAFWEMRAEIQTDPSAMQADKAVLETWYNQDPIPRLDKIAGSHRPLEGLMLADPVARRLQADYIARNPKPRRRIGVYNQGTMSGRTPNLGRLAAEGVRFTDYYGEASCTAGRANFITGELPIRTGLTTVGQAGSPLGMPDEVPTIATVLKSMGYATGRPTVVAAGGDLGIIDGVGRNFNKPPRAKPVRS